jgi:hypothetical protein
LDSAAELIRIAAAVGSAVLVLNAVDSIRRKLENGPSDQGTFLSEGLFYIDEDPLRAFFMVDAESMIVEVTDFRIL